MVKQRQVGMSCVKQFIPTFLFKKCILSGCILVLVKLQVFQIEEELQKKKSSRESIYLFQTKNYNMSNNRNISRPTNTYCILAVIVSIREFALRERTTNPKKMSLYTILS